MGVCTKERKGVTAAVLMATPCTNSLGGESGGQKHDLTARMWLSKRKAVDVFERRFHYDKTDEVSVTAAGE